MVRGILLNKFRQVGADSHLQAHRTRGSVMAARKNPLRAKTETLYVKGKEEKENVRL